MLRTNFHRVKAANVSNKEEGYFLEEGVYWIALENEENRMKFAG